MTSLGIQVFATLPDVPDLPPVKFMKVGLTPVKFMKVGLTLVKFMKVGLTPVYFTSASNPTSTNPSGTNPGCEVSIRGARLVAGIQG